MARTPEYTQNQSDQVVKIYGEVIDDFVANTGKKLQTPDSLLKKIEDNPLLVNEWKNSRYSLIPVLRQENTEALGKKLDDILLTSNEVIAESGYGDVLSQESKFTDAAKAGYPLRAVVDIEDSPALKEVLKGFQAQAANRLNLTNTTLINDSMQRYRNIVDEATLKVMTGQTTLDKAVRSASRRFAQDGYTGFIRSNGTTIETEAAVNAIMRTTTNNVAIAMQDARAEEYGNSFFEISQHSDARTLCAKDQGKVVDKSLRFRNETVKGTWISDWSQTSFGEAAGIFGVNCRHDLYPFFPGLSEKSEKIDTTENKKNYKQSQEQRRLERKIRSAKREKIVAESRKDKQEVDRAQKKVSAAQAEMRTFINKTDRTRRYNREQVVN